MAAEIHGNTGEKGTLKVLSKSGRRLRSTGTASDTRRKAVRVPMLIMYSSLPIGVSAATSATIVPMPTVILTGVPVRGLVLPSEGGSSQSRYIAKTTRVEPMSSVMTTVVRPATAPAEMSVA